MSIKPFGYRVVIQLLDESDSGLVVVRDNDDGVKRGIILEVGHGDEDDDYPELTPGNIVHFTSGHQIGQVWVVEMVDVIAYEPFKEDDREGQPGWKKHTT